MGSVASVVLGDAESMEVIFSFLQLNFVCLSLSIFPLYFIV